MSLILYVQASLLSSTNGNQDETLAALLNSDPILDLHVVEAVKLHMLQHAMELHKESSSGSDNVPLFAILMFARDTSETPKDLMNNHLREVGNSGGLEQVSCCFLLQVVVIQFSPSLSNFCACRLNFAQESPAHS
jgi:ubiquitin thioesterase otulin